MNIARFVLIFLVFFAGCQKKGSPTSPPPLKYLRVTFHNDIRSLDPRIGVDLPSAFVTKMLFEGLTRIGINGEVEPAIAKSYTISEDLKTYTFQLRSTYWSNGDPLTAEDFIYSWEKIIDPESSFVVGQENFYPIKNVPEVVRGELPLESAGIRALDSKTIQIELAHPTPYFLESLATPSYFPVHSKLDQDKPQWTETSETFVCNGPFLLGHYRPENEIVVKKNKRYWDGQSVSLPGIHIAIIKDVATQLSLFEKKQIEWMGNPLSRIPLDAIEHLKNHGELKSSDALALHCIFLNTDSFPLNNVKLRKALTYAIDRKSITEHVLKGGETPALGLLPKQISTQDVPYFEDNNQELAKQLFQEALEEMGLTKVEFPALSFSFSTSTAHRRIAEVLQQQWKHTFDIDIILEPAEWRVHFDKLQKGNYQIGGVQWQSWLRDPIYMMQNFREKDSSFNLARWENAEYSELISLAEKEPDLAYRKQLFNRAETILMDELPVIPIYFMTITHAKSDKLKDVYISDLFQIDFRWAKLED